MPAAAGISVTITGVPAGATLSAGTLNNDGSYTLTPAQLSGLYLVSDGEVQRFSLTVTPPPPHATPSPYTTLFRSTIGVTVTPVADAPHLDLNSVTAGDQHTATAAG